MMTFKRFITEDRGFDLEKFKSDCEFFLEHIEGSSSLLWRGLHPDFMPDDYDVKSFAERTKTLDMLPNVHAFINSYYYEKINARIRNWIFCTGNRTLAAEYTVSYNPCLIFPIGRFDWFCFKDRELKDLYHYVSNIKSGVDRAFRDEKAAERQFYDSLESSLDSAEYWYNKNLRACAQSGNEVMIRCKSYYIFSIGNDSSPTTFSSEVLPYLEREILNVSKRDNFTAK
jgi:hypothetical protein